MNRILRLVTTFAVSLLALRFIKFELPQSIDILTLATYLLIVIIWLVINFLYETVNSIVLKKQRDKKVIEHEKYKVYTNDWYEMYMDYKDKHEQECIVTSNQAKEIDNLNSRIKILNKQDKATIKLGDKVTSVTRLKPSRVCEIKLIDNVPHYRLSAKGKYYKASEIRKVEKTN